MSEITESSTKFKHFAIARICPRNSDTATVYVDAWDSAVGIPVAMSDLPADVVQALNDKRPLIAAEARVNLGAENYLIVIGEIIKALDVPSDEEMGF